MRITDRVDVSNEFGPLTKTRDRDGRVVPAMNNLAVATEKWQHVRTLWMALPDHPAVLSAIESSERGLVLRYAALTGAFHPIESANDLASYGAQLADVYRMLLPGLAAVDIGQVLRPALKVDAAGQLRVGFRPIEEWTPRYAPETRKTWPTCDERALVYLVGEIVSDRIFTLRHSALLKVIGRCRESNPAKRFQTLNEVYDAFKQVGPIKEPLTAGDAAAWRTIEEGIGWLELGDAARAIKQFEGMLDHPRYAKVTRAAHSLASQALDRSAARKGPHERSASVAGSASAARIPWATAEREGLRFEAEADLVRALDFARRAIGADETHAAARAVLVKALLARGDHREALAHVDWLLASAPGDGTHHYLRGKVLFALGRLDDARAAFDAASSLQPTLLEAMLLRREVDRCAAMGRKQVGSQGPIAFELPASLTELRDVLISGRTDDAIVALSDPRFANDPDAQLVLARTLAVVRKIERAVAIYDRVASMPDPHRYRALVGKGSMLLDLGRHEAALALFDVVCAEKPNDADASEGRAHALEKIGRTAEAAAEYRRFIALATSRSDVRVRSAQLWLEQHS